MKAYLLFAGNQYYPRQGVRDLRGSFDSIHDAKTAVTLGDFDWAVVVEHASMREVCEAEGKRGAEYDSPREWAWEGV